MLLEIVVLSTFLASQYGVAALARTLVHGLLCQNECVVEFALSMSSLTS